MTTCPRAALACLHIPGRSAARWAAALALSASLAAPLSAQCEVEAITELGPPIGGQSGLRKVRADIGTDGVRRWVSWRQDTPTSDVVLYATGDDGSVLTFSTGEADTSLWLGMDGDIVVFGCPGPDTAGVRNLLTGVTIDLPKPAGASDNYGRACDVEQLGPDEYLVAVSATGTGSVQEGEVYLFHLLNGSIVQEETVVSPIPQGGSFFGSGLALDSGNLVISQHAWDSPTHVNTGAAQFYRYTDPTLPGPLTITHEWTDFGSLGASGFGGGGDNYYFGWKPAVDGDLIVIGSPLADPFGVVDAGEYSLYGWTGSSFTCCSTNTASAVSGKIGFDTAVDGDLVLVGAPGTSQVYVADLDFNVGSVTPNEDRYFSLVPSAPSAGFGESVAVLPGRAFVAAPDSALSAEPGMGAVHDVLVGRAETNNASKLSGIGLSMRYRVDSDVAICPGTSLFSRFDGVPASTLGILVLGVSELSAPAKGGVLYPTPFKFFNLPSPPSGSLSFWSVLPTGTPDYSLFLQAWYPSAAGPAGWLATNGMRVDVPSDL